jgi:hypothetical protein
LSTAANFHSLLVVVGSGVRSSVGGGDVGRASVGRGDVRCGVVGAVGVGRGVVGVGVVVGQQSSSLVPTLDRLVFRGEGGHGEDDHEDGDLEGRKDQLIIIKSQQ